MGLVAACAILLLLHIGLPYYEAFRFIKRSTSTDPARIKAAMPRDVSFKLDPVLGGDWYGLYWRGAQAIGPFPLSKYSDPTTLNLKIEPPSITEWLLGQRTVRVFGRKFTKHFVVSYSGVSYEQGVESFQGQAE